MATTARNLLTTHSVAPIDYDVEPTPSRKAWTEEFAPFLQQQVRVWPPTYAAVEEMLGPGSVLSNAASVGLETPAYILNSVSQKMSSEGDVTMDFNLNISLPISLAFSGGAAISRMTSGELQTGGPKLWSRSQVGSANSTSRIKVVDFQMTMAHQEPSLEMPAMIGEMKRCRAIRGSEWLYREVPSPVTINLQQELRAYAWHYKCPQIFIFDSRSAVIVQFRATSPESIKKVDCPIDCCVIPRENQAPNQCTISYALYRLAWRGWIRLCATLESTTDDTGNLVRTRKSVSIDGYRRKYKYWSGNPVWVDNHNQEYDSHPRGYQRDFIYTNHQRRNGTMETHGSWVWRVGDRLISDTTNCLISGY